MYCQGRIEKNKFEVKSLFHAVKTSNVEELKSLLSKMSDIVNCIDDKNRTLLYYAGLNASEEMMSILIDHGAKTNIPDPYTFEVALHFAVYMKNLQLVLRLLRENDEETNNREVANGPEKMYVTPLTCALDLDSEEVIEALVTYPNVHLIHLPRGFSLISFVLRYNCNHLRRLKLILEWTVKKYGQEALAAELNRFGNTNGSHLELFTPLTLVCSHNSPIVARDRVEVVKLLVSYGADVNLMRLSKDVDPILFDSRAGYFDDPGLISPLHFCLIDEDIQTVRHLILNGAVFSHHLTLKYGMRSATLFKLLTAKAEQNVLTWSLIEAWLCDHVSKEVLKLCLKWSRQPLSLKHLARASVLRNQSVPLGSTMENEIDKMDIPNELKDYLSLRDLSD